MVQFKHRGDRSQFSGELSHGPAVERPDVVPVARERGAACGHVSRGAPRRRRSGP